MEEIIVQPHTWGMVLTSLTFFIPMRLAGVLGERITKYLLLGVVIFSTSYHAYAVAVPEYDAIRSVLNTCDRVFAVCGVLYLTYFAIMRFRRLATKFIHTGMTASYVGLFAYGNATNSVYEMTHSLTHIWVQVVICIVMIAANRKKFSVWLFFCGPWK